MSIHDKIKDWKTNDSSSVCLSECVKPCCAWEKVKVLMTEEQVRKAYRLSPDETLYQFESEEKILLEGLTPGKEDGYYWVSLGSSTRGPHCAAYNYPKPKHCSIHDDKPDACKIMPIRIEDNAVHLHPSCHVARYEGHAVFNKLYDICEAHKHEMIAGDKVMIFLT